MSQVELPLRRRLTALGLGLFLAAGCALGAVFGAEQLAGLATSRAIQHGGLAIATTERVSSTGAHGGAYLIVYFITRAGQPVRTTVHDGNSDAVHHRNTLPVRYDPYHPAAAEVDGQPMHTRGQAVIDLVLAAVFAVVATPLLLAACGSMPLSTISQRRSNAHGRVPGR